MKVKNKKYWVLAIPLLLLAASACTARDAAVDECLNNPARPPIIVKTGSGSWPGNNTVPDDSPVDLRGYVRAGDITTGMKIGGNLQTRDNLCLVGGDFSTTHDEEETPWHAVDPDGPGPLTTPTHWHRQWGILIDIPNVQLIGQSVRNTGDAFGFYDTKATNWKIIGARVDGGTEYPEGAYIHDDCVENDFMHGGQILDSKFDGCHSFLSSNFNWNNTSTPGPDGSGNTIEIRDSLVRLQAMKNSYNPEVYGYWKHAGFFKWSRDALTGPVDLDGKAPNVVMSNVIFRTDQAASYGGTELGKLSAPPRSTCDNVVIVGWEILNAAEQASWNDCADRGPAIGEDGVPNVQSGTVAQWDQAVSIWDAAHPYPIPDPEV